MTIIDNAQRSSKISNGDPGETSRERDVRSLYSKHFGRRKERQLISTGSFFVTFATVRAITHAIRAQRGPFKNFTLGGRHIHHMTFGITGLLTVGFLWLLEIGTNEQRLASNITSVVYGTGAALTLDEFALWLNLEDDYWTTQGRESIDAVVLFGSLLGMSALGRGFFAEILRARPEQDNSGVTASPVLEGTPLLDLEGTGAHRPNAGTR
jgi:hypothetical protein